METIKHCPNLPSRKRRSHHGQVGLSAGARKSGRKELLDTLGVSDAHHQHVLCQPPLIPGHTAGNAEGKTLLAQKGITPIATAIRNYLALQWEVGYHDVLGIVRPMVDDLVGEGRTLYNDIAFNEFEICN